MIRSIPSSGHTTRTLAFDGDGAFLSSLAGVAKVSDFGQYVEIRLRPGTDPQDLLQASTASLEIRRFEIMTPTLHNIFIQQVGGDASDA